VFLNITEDISSLIIFTKLFKCIDVAVITIA